LVPEKASEMKSLPNLTDCPNGRLIGKTSPGMVVGYGSAGECR